MTITGRAMRSTFHADGKLDLSLIEFDLDPPVADELIIKVEGAPINPSDLMLMFGNADIESIKSSGPAERPKLQFCVPPEHAGSMARRIGQSLPVGNEGAGLVIAAGAAAQEYVGRRVALAGGGMFADLRKACAGEVIQLPDGATAAEGAAMFINPLTALGFVETARREGHRAIINTAAASNLGIMLQRICRQDGMPLINIVRSRAQAELLAEKGATYILDSSDAKFDADLVDGIRETGATIAFDATGGGGLGGTILRAMEMAAVQDMTEYSRYGSDILKQLYIYGALDRSPLLIERASLGFRWSVSGWLLTPFLRSAGQDVVARLKQRVADELTTNFSSSYTRTIGLAEALHPDIVRAYERRATGEKYLIDPTFG